MLVVAGGRKSVVRVQVLAVLYELSKKRLVQVRIKAVRVLICHRGESLTHSNIRIGVSSSSALSAVSIHPYLGVLDSRSIVIFYEWQNPF